MIIKIDDYILDRRIVAFAADEKTQSFYQQQNMSYCFCEEDHLIIFPECIRFSLSEESFQFFHQRSDCDVLQINCNGIVHLLYDSKDDDVGFVLTPHCNSNCIMCPASEYQRKKEDEPPVSEFYELIRYLPVYVHHITVTGGEPFLIGPQIFDILCALKAKMTNTSFLLLTNGRALSYLPFVYQLNDSIPSNTVIGIPLHGFDAKSHDRITQAHGSFEQTVLGIHNLLRFGHKVELRIVVSKLNYHFIDKIAAFICSEFPNIYCVKIMGLEMLGNAARNKEAVWIQYRDAFLASKPAIDILIRNAISVNLYNFPLCSIDREYRMIAAKSITAYKVRFSEKCRYCAIKDACGGLFFGTYRLAAQSISPVTDYD